MVSEKDVDFACPPSYITNYVTKLLPFDRQQCPDRTELENIPFVFSQYNPTQQRT